MADAEAHPANARGDDELFLVAKVRACVTDKGGSPPSGLVSAWASGGFCRVVVCGSVVVVGVYTHWVGAHTPLVCGRRRRREGEGGRGRGHLCHCP